MEKGQSEIKSRGGKIFGKEFQIKFISLFKSQGEEILQNII